MTRKERFYETYKRYEEEANEAKRHAQVAKEEHRKSDYEFWKQIFEDARRQGVYFFNEYMNCND